jgi:hypothetical protein
VAESCGRSHPARVTAFLDLSRGPSWGIAHGRVEPSRTGTGGGPPTPKRVLTRSDAIAREEADARTHLSTTGKADTPRSLRRVRAA